MDVDPMGVTVVEPVCLLVWLLVSVHPCFAVQVLVRHDQGLDVVLPRAVLDAYPVAEQMGCCPVVERHRVGQDVAQQYLLWTGMDYYQGVEQAVLVQVSELAYLRLALVQVLPPVFMNPSRVRTNNTKKAGGLSLLFPRK